MEWHLDKTQLVESIRTSLVLKSGHFQITNCLPRALSQLSPNLEKYIAEAETQRTDCSQVVSTVSGQLTKGADRGSLQPVLAHSLPAHSSWGQLTSPASRWWKPDLNSPVTQQLTNCTCSTRTQTGHCLPFVLRKRAQASLFVGQSLNTFKKHILRQNAWNASPLHQLDLVPFPQRCTDLSHIHPQTWTCHKHTVGRISAPCSSSSVWLLPDQLSFMTHSGFCKISVSYS